MKGTTYLIMVISSMADIKTIKNMDMVNPSIQIIVDIWANTRKGREKDMENTLVVVDLNMWAIMI